MDRTDLFRCPRCKGKLVATDKAHECRTCRLAYPIVDGIPTFIPAEATPLADDRSPDQR